MSLWMVGAQRLWELIKRVRGSVFQVEKTSALRTCRVLNYCHGVSIKSSNGIEISNCNITSTAEIQANTLFLDIWKPATDAYGSAIYLEEVTDANIHDNDLQHQMNGLLSYQCRRLAVMNNLASYCSGFGFHLFETCESIFAENHADFCCRYYLSEAGSIWERMPPGS